ncbi:LuxR C-terminal-related transcriptional regulator [Mesorhizobium sp. L48C026A00]|uniref:LuxR C-terminal-related transcriptional regulator n=1 Tax=Mesorhizobium sp. L48C026A00 TaxID=1287182 RepID=UPI0012EBF298
MKAGTVEFLSNPQRRGVVDSNRAFTRTEQDRPAFDPEVRLPPASSPTAQPSRAGGVLAGYSFWAVEQAGRLRARHSEITVKEYRGQVMRKMQATSLADSVTMAASRAAIAL